MTVEGKLAPESLQKIDQLMAQATADPKNDLPNASFYAVNRDGEVLVNVAKGQMGSETPEPIDDRTIFWIASCTKMIVAMALMREVEQGNLLLDDPEQVEKLIPEISKLPILKDVKENGEFVLVPRKNRITLRHLMTHTAGFGYHFLDESLHKWRQSFKHNVFDGHISDLMEPLRFEPGTDFAYGISMDWAGTCLERATGLNLEQYCQKHLFQPLGLDDVSFTPNKQLQKRLVKMNHRDSKDAPLHESEQPMARALREDRGDFYHSAGAGIFTSPRSYCRLLTVLLNDGLDKQTGNRILKEDTVKQMFTNQIPHMPQFGRKGLGSAEPYYQNGSEEMLDQRDVGPNVEQGWGLSMMMNTTAPYKTGRSINTGNWGGIANLAWWCDREKGVAGFFGTQILPFGDKAYLPLIDKLESEVYNGLR